MKLFISIFILLFLILIGQGTEERRYANIYGANNKIVGENNSSLQNILLSVSFFDEQDFSDFNDINPCIFSSFPEVQPIVKRVESVTFIPKSAYKLSLQYSLIDLPPPSLS